MRAAPDGMIYSIPRETLPNRDPFAAIARWPALSHTVFVGS